MNEKDFFLFISSDDSSFHPQNKIYNFIVALPERLNLLGKWEVGLCDFFQTGSSPEVLYIFTDLCDYSHVKVSVQPILQIIYPHSSEKEYIFPHLFYIPVTNTITRLNFYIQDKTLRLLTTLSGEIQLTLHFRKKKNG